MFRRVRLVSPHPPDELARRLRLQTRAEQNWIGWFKGERDLEAAADACFSGTVGKSSFDIRRKTRYSTPSIPQITGAFAADATGSRIDVLMWVHPLSAVFMLLFLALTGYGTIRSLLDNSVSTQSPFVPAGMFVLGLVCFVLPFIAETRITERKLCEILDAAPAERARPPLIGR